MQQQSKVRLFDISKHMSMVMGKSLHYFYQLTCSTYLYRFDFCVPPTDKTSPTENLGQVCK